MASDRRISAERFYKSFLGEWNAAIAQGDLPAEGNPFLNKRAWTDYMLHSEGFLKRVMDKVASPELPLQYRNEWYTVDALYIMGENFFPKTGEYPSSVQVLIEHELGEDLEEEMWKLLHWRAPLKVIIGYDWSEDEKTTVTRQVWAKNKISKLLRMLKAVNENFPENPDTEYLFILGRQFTDEALSWSAHSVKLPLAAPPLLAYWGRDGMYLATA